MTAGTTDTVDAVIVGAGFSGLYMLRKLRDELGLRARVLETGDGVGGTWYWNRYPGARSDSDSYIYGFTFDQELWESWEWSERYPESHEIRSYLEHVAQRFDLTRDITFSTRVESATFDEDRERWDVVTDTGETITATYVVSAVGALSASNTPSFPGLESFAGPTFHTGHWPHEGVDFTGRRVGIIGSGASAVQAVPLIAAQARELTVFQRTANYIVPANNGPIDPEVRAARREDWAGIRERIQQSNFGFELYLQEQGAADVSDAEREALLEEYWNRGGFHIWLGSYADIFFTAGANDLVRDFLDRKIREKVDDPETADLLVPRGHPFGVKRNPLDSGYFEAFNQPHVRLVDVLTDPIAGITPSGVRQSSGAEHTVDALVLATGFDAMTGPLDRIDLRGRGGQLLREKWAVGPRTYLGLMSHGFPNLFTITGPQSPSVLSNMPVSIEQHVDYIGRIVADLRARGATLIEPVREAEDAWCDYNQEIADATLFPSADTWYMGANIPGKPRRFMPNLDFVGPYRAKCDQIAENGWEGFAVDGDATPAGDHVYRWVMAG